MKAAVLVVLIWVAALGWAPAFAGSLDPPLARLLNRKTATVRSTAGFSAVAANAFQPRVDELGRVQVYVHPVAGINVATLARQLKEFGAQDIVSAPRLRIVQAWIAAAKLQTLAALGAVGRVGLPTYMQTFPGSPRSGAARAVLPEATGRVVPGGLAIDSQAPAALQASVLAANGASGAGVKVGVLSGDIWGLAASQAAGYLPASIWDDPTLPGTSPIPGNPAEGTALLEIVHAVAPQASLGFCAPATSVDVLTCYQDFIHWGANVIANDMQLHATDMFAAGFTDDGSVAWAAEQIAEAHPDVTFVNAAGNEAQDYFEARYTPGPGATLNGTHYASLMDFGAAAGGASVTRLPVKFNYISAFTPVLEWNDPVHAAADSFVMALVDQDGRVLATGTSFTATDGRPGVFLSYVPRTVSQAAFIEIACRRCANPVTLKLNGFADGAATFALNTLGSVGYGQAVIPGTLTVAAASVSQLNPLGVSSEFFTGPGPFLYGDYGATGVETKPDLSGIDNIIVSGAGGFNSGGPAPGGGAIFLGTSAAVPNLAGLLADLISGIPGLPASRYYIALKDTASQSAFSAAGSAAGFNAGAAGAGLAQGVAAWNALSPRTIPYVTAVAPAYAAPGSAFEIQVSGAGFMPGATLNFDGTALATTFVSSSVLSAQVPATLTGISGVFNLTVSNPEPADTVSNTVNYFLGDPVPGITSWAPQQVTAGSAAFTLAVHGTGFMQGAVVKLGGHAAPTTFVSATQLQAVIPAAVVAQPGEYELVVINPVSGGISSSTDFSVQASPPPAPAKSSGGGGIGVCALLLLALCSVRMRRRSERNLLTQPGRVRPPKVSRAGRLQLIRRD